MSFCGRSDNTEFTGCGSFCCADSSIDFTWLSTSELRINSTSGWFVTFSLCGFNTVMSPCQPSTKPLCACGFKWKFYRPIILISGQKRRCCAFVKNQTFLGEGESTPKISGQTKSDLYIPADISFVRRVLDTFFLSVYFCQLNGLYFWTDNCQWKCKRGLSSTDTQSSALVTPVCNVTCVDQRQRCLLYLTLGALAYSVVPFVICPAPRCFLLLQTRRSLECVPYLRVTV